MRWNRATLVGIGFGLSLVIVGATRLAAAPDDEAAPSPPDGMSRDAETGTLHWDADGAEMVAVPAGSFVMGAPFAWDHEDKESKPEREVELGAYFIDRYEVTNGLYKHFLAKLAEDGHGKCHPDEPEGRDHTPHGFGTKRYSAYGGSDDHPVILVDWFDAWAYASWAGKRLPTEAEWEKAARGTDARLFPWGDARPDQMGPRGVASKIDGELRANWRGNADGQVMIGPVGQFPAGASPYGALDMAGNVWEWCEDWFAPYPGADESLKLQYKVQKLKVMRGGSWRFGSQDIMSTHRHFYPEQRREIDTGFRCVVSARE